MGKLRTLVALGILFLLPIISFILLSNGGKITLNALSKLNLEVPVQSLFTVALEPDLKNTTGVICYLCQDEVDMDNLYQMSSDYNKEEQLNLLVVGDALSTDDSVKPDYIHTFPAETATDAAYMGHVLVLDKEGNVRRAMQPQTLVDWQDLSRSIALLMPRKTKPQVIYKKPN